MTDLKTVQVFLRENYVSSSSFEQLEESCIPSYTHSNLLMARIAWSRITKAVKLWERFRSRNGSGNPDVLDFGCGSGVLHMVLPTAKNYHFAEIDDALADRVASHFQNSMRVPVTDLGIDRFDAVFALDSLEHNEDIVSLLEQIHGSLKPGGLFVLSGPSENLIYKIGRFLAGFKGGYHYQTIYDIEAKVKDSFEKVVVRQTPFGVPLFRISVWKKMGL